MGGPIPHLSCQVSKEETCHAEVEVRLDGVGNDNENARGQGAIPTDVALDSRNSPLVLVSQPASHVGGGKSTNDHNASIEDSVLFGMAWVVALEKGGRPESNGKASKES